MVDGEVDGIGVGLEAVLVFSVGVFDGLPAVLDGIEVGRVGWQVFERALAFFDERPHVVGLVEPGIIHDDNFSRRECRGEALPHIFGKDVGVAVALEAERCLQFTPAERGDNAGAPKAVAGFFAVKPWASLAPAARQAMAVVDATFIDVDQRVLGNITERFSP